MSPPPPLIDGVKIVSAGCLIRLREASGIKLRQYGTKLGLR
jgi:hypothetical protein